MARTTVPVRKPAPSKPAAPADELGMELIAKPLRQLGSDVKVGSRQLGDLFQGSVQAVKTGYRKVKSFLKD